MARRAARTVARAPTRTPTRIRGTSLIEVLVTLTIVAIGLLGLLALQARSQNWQRDSFDRKTAAELSEQLVERIRGNHLGWAQSGYAAVAAPFLLNAPPGAGPAMPVCAGACTAAELALRDLSAWSVDLRRRLPQSAARLERDVNALGTLTVAWREPAAANGAEAADPACGAMGLAASEGWRCLRTSVYP